MGGEVLAVPGIILEGWANLIIILLSSDSYIALTRSWLVFEALFYCIAIFLLLRATRVIRS